MGLHGQTQGMQRISLVALARQPLNAARRAGGGHTADTVYGGRENVLRHTVIGMVQGASMAEHENPGEATVRVLLGRVRLSSGELSWEARSGDMIFVPDARRTAIALRPHRVSAARLPLRPDHRHPCLSSGEQTGTRLSGADHTDDDADVALPLPPST